jgi:hypothetical protein
MLIYIDPRDLRTINHLTIKTSYKINYIYTHALEVYDVQYIIKIY